MGCVGNFRPKGIRIVCDWCGSWGRLNSGADSGHDGDIDYRRSLKGASAIFDRRGFELFVIDVEIGVDWILVLDSGHDGNI